MHRDIAVIGIAGRFPDARNTDELAENLKAGKDSVRDPSAGRLKSTALPADKPYKAAGYLEGIECFDHDFFGLPFEEAQAMDPHQRLLLEIVHEAIENAGYRPGHFAGTDAATYVGSAPTDYYKHADRITPSLVTGNSGSFLASRINRAFGLHGNAVVVEAACASSLVALQQACNALLLGETGCALVCGVNLELFPFREDPDESVLASPDGKSRAFSARAAGMSSGEAVGCLVCKPLDQALADGDHIQAVIKAVVTNNNARRSLHLTAPDSAAQAEAAVRAWQLANITPDQLGYLEAHGSGTLLGDSIEISGLDLAFRTYTAATRLCPVATIKSNIGHTNSAAGLVGLIKAILALRQRVIFPAIHVEEPSPLINFGASALYLPRQAEPWAAGPGQTRYAAVNAVSQNGTNCHVVVGEAPAPRPAPAGTGAASPYALITCSSRRPEGVRDNLAALREKLLRPAATPALPDISYTLGQGRAHYRHRCAFVVRSRGELLRAIEAYLETAARPGGTEALQKVIFVLTDHAHVPASLWQHCLAGHPPFRAAYDACLRYASAGVSDNAGLGAFVFQYCFYKLIEAYGITTGTFLSVGVGKVVRSVLAGDISLQAGVAAAETYRPGGATEDLDKRIGNLLAKESAGGPVAFVPLGPASDLSRGITGQRVAGSGVHCFALPDDPESSPLLELFRFLYLAGYDVPWETFFGHQGGAKTDLPGYQFEKKRCWLREAPRPGEGPAPVPAAQPAPARRNGLAGEATPAEHKIAALWQEVLPVDGLTLADDFYAMGGSAASMDKVIGRIRESFGVAPATGLPGGPVSVKSQAAAVFQQLGTRQKIALFWEEVLGSDQSATARNFFEVGGHSLLAIKIINRINQSFGCNLTLKEFFLHPTVDAMTACLDAAATPGPGVPDRSIEKLAAEGDEYAVSHAQKRIWIASQVAGGAAAYNIPYAAELKGTLDKARFQRVFETLIARHESLRTVFCQVAGEIRQRILPAAAVGFRIEHRTLAGQADGPAQAAEWAAAEAAEPFDLEKGPLLRATLIELEAGTHVFLLTIHHLISDGWSMKVLMQEMQLLYQAYGAGKGNPLAPLRIQYKDYAAWQNRQVAQGEDLSRQRAYWLAQLGGELPALNLPADGVRSPAKADPCGTVRFELGEPLGADLRKLAQAQEATVFTTLLAAVKLLFFKYTAQGDIRVGT
ncbi:MAG: hypothetical protein ICV83_21095, partial [Cytophagales bacterium]|nr:hypothetical protein [Cytophagales bacterium]